MHRTKMDDTAIAAALQTLNAGAVSPWLVQGGKLHKRYRFGNFSEAFGFMTRVALVAESMHHHPDWCNIDKTIHVQLSTHDIDGLTELDFSLAARMDQIAG